MHLSALLQYWKFLLSKQFKYLLWFSKAGGVPQVFLTAQSGTVQIPVSAVQLHQVGGGPLHPSLPASYFFILTLGIPLPVFKAKIPSQEAHLFSWADLWWGRQASRRSLSWLTRANPSLHMPFPPDGCDRAAGRKQQQPHRVTGGEPGHRPQHQE